MRTVFSPPRTITFFSRRKYTYNIKTGRRRYVLFFFIELRHHSRCSPKSPFLGKNRIEEILLPCRLRKSPCKCIAREIPNGVMRHQLVFRGMRRYAIVAGLQRECECATRGSSLARPPRIRILCDSSVRKTYLYAVRNDDQ